MSERSSYEPGTPNWIDLMTPDPEASKAFYTGLFGWDAKDEHDPEGAYIYTNYSLRGKTVAGMGPQQPGMEGMPNVWNSYVSVEDAEQTLKAAEAAGGTILMPAMDVMEHGKMGILADPTGATISAWQPGVHKGAQLVNEPNTYSWNELMTRDIDAALRFYGEVFGWEYEAMVMPEGSTYHVIKGGGEGLGGLMAMPEDVPDEVPNYWGVYFTVEDCDAMTEKARGLGATVTMGPMDLSVGRISGLADPRGGAFTIMQPAQQ